ncbi:putative ribosomal protein S6 kinase 2 beta-like [Sesbania bispinosa]|nr:putative ribosomal protein S6 kinase 2 beta-like [Sesbania bispinosa]
MTTEGYAMNCDTGLTNTKKASLLDVGRWRLARRRGCSRPKVAAEAEGCATML